MISWRSTAGAQLPRTRSCTPRTREAVARPRPPLSLPRPAFSTRSRSVARPFVPLAEARALVELYAEKGDRKYERAALEYLRRDLDEANPSLTDVAQIAALLAERGILMRGV